MENNEQIEQVHGLEFFEKHFNDEKAFIKFVNSFRPDMEAYRHLDLVERPEKMQVIELSRHPETGEYEETVYIDIKEEAKEVLTKEIKSFQKEIKNALRKAQPNESRTYYLEDILTILAMLHLKAKKWKVFKDLHLNKEVFAQFIIELYGKHKEFIKDEELSKMIKKIIEEIYPEHHLRNYMDNEAYTILTEWLIKDKERSKIKDKIEYAALVKNDLVLKGYIKKKKLTYKVVTWIIRDTWGIQISESRVKQVGKTSWFNLPAYDRP